MPQQPRGAKAPPAPAAPGAGFRSPVGCTAESLPGADAFVAWCAEHKVLLPSAHIGRMPATGRAVVASRDIKLNETVVEVPDNALLMVENCSIAEILAEEGMAKPADDELLEVQGLILAVMYEKSIGSASRWAAYLEFLPADMSHMPLYWKRSEFQELRGTAAYDKMMGRVQHPADAPVMVPELWDDIIRPFIEEHPELHMPNGEVGYELYRWATCAVASYSFILGDDKYQAMVPVWDALNHITGKVNVRLFHCTRRKMLQMIATRDIRAGEELVNNYGELSNAELLRGYGFVEKDNPNNHAQLPLRFVVRAARDVLAAAPAGGSNPERRAGGRTAGPGPGSAAAAAAAAPSGTASGGGAAVRARLRLCRRHGLLPEHNVFKLFEGRPPPAALTEVLRLLTLPDQDFLRFASQPALAERSKAQRKQRAASGTGAAASGLQHRHAHQSAGTAGGAGSAKVEGLGLSGSQEAVVLQSYQRVCSRLFERFTCSLAEDEALAAQLGQLKPRAQAALLARMPEKRALAWIQGAVSSSEGAALIRGQPDAAWNGPTAAMHNAVTTKGGATHAHGKRSTSAGARDAPPPALASAAHGKAPAAKPEAFSFGFKL